ncbi:MAG: DUF1127 domain-containing protein [Pseudooceanicola sp.]
MTTYITTRPTCVASQPRPASLIARVFSLLGLHASRQSLARLDDKLLEDIGITREQALKEARRPVWDVPTGWRR